MKVAVHLIFLMPFCFAATTRQHLLLLEQLKASMQDIKDQLSSQAVLLQWVVARFGGMEEAVASLPDGVTLPCAVIDDIHQLEDQIGNKEIRSKVVRLFLFLRYVFSFCWYISSLLEINKNSTFCKSPKIVENCFF